MDKLRALQYFVAAAQEHSFSGAARRLEVSVPAVAKLITTLEHKLGANLFDRTAHGLTMTADGQRYLEDCQPLLEQLAAADEAVIGAAARPRGTLTVGTPPTLAQHCILPALPRFHARYPDIQVDIRIVHRPSDTEAKAADALIVLGWPEHPDFVHRRIAQTRSLICAAPAYWAAHGVPQRPKDLERHVCLLFRNQEGIVVDLWQYERGAEKEAAAVSGWLVCSHRDVILDAAIAGEGVARMSDLSIRAHLRSGRLVPVLLDWVTKDAPPVNLLYRPHHRRTPRVMLICEFITELFRKLEAERDEGVAAPLTGERPYWYRRGFGRASSAARARD